MVSNQPSTIAVLEREGVILKPKGASLWGLCPFPLHTEKTPSFKVSASGFYCFGCHTGGRDSIALVMKMYGLSFKEALAYLGIKQGSMSTADTVAAFKAKQEREKKRAYIKQYKKWEQAEVNDISFILRAYRKMRRERKTPLAKVELETLAKLNGNIEYLEYIYFDVLLGQDEKLRLDYYEQEMQGGKQNSSCRKYK